MTAAGAVPHSEIEQITIVELIPEVVEAARLLGEANSHIVDDPRTRVAVDDARHFLLATDQQFDVIVADLFVPWESETGYLYTVEHYARCRAALKPGGLCCQWLAAYQLGPDEFTLIANSFAEVFPEVSVWWGHLDPRRPILALVGTEQPLQRDRSQLRRRLAELRAASAADDPWLDSPERLMDLLAGSWPADPAATLNTREHPRLEFRAPLAHQNRRLLSRENLEQFFDETLANLPPADIDLAPSDAPDGSAHKVRVQNQRLMLFGR
jgi:spermidine synthase